MKKKMITVFLALATVGCAVSYAGTRIPESPLTIVKSGTVYKVIYKNDAISVVTVSIYDREEKLIFREDVPSDDGFIRPYNLSQLPEGQYRISVADKAHVFSETVSTVAEKELVAQITKLDSPGDKYLVSVPYQGGEQIIIRFYDERNQLIYDETAIGHHDFAKVFQLKNLESGSTVQVVNVATGKEKSVAIE